MATDFSKVLLDPEERIIKVVGQGYIASLMDGSLASTFIILTDKRIYFRGVQFSLPLNRATENKIVPLRKVTGVKFVTTEFWIRKILGLIFLPLGIAGIALSLSNNFHRNFGLHVVVIALTILLIQFSIGFLFDAFFGKQKMFIVEYPGGSIATLAKFFSAAELYDFQHCVFIERSIMAEGNSNPAINRVFPDSVSLPSDVNIRKMLHDRDERAVFALGEGYITGLLKGSLSKNIMVVSNKRVYAYGRLYKGGLRLSGSQIVELKDIRGAKFIEYKPTPYLIRAIICLGLSWPLIPFFFAGVFYLILYFLRKDKLFQIDYPGGTTEVSVKLYSKSELRAFIKKLNMISNIVRGLEAA